MSLLFLLTMIIASSAQFCRDFLQLDHRLGGPWYYQNIGNCSNITCAWPGDAYLFGCELYEGAQWCLESGDVGPGWSNGMHQFGWPPKLQSYADKTTESQYLNLSESKTSVSIAHTPGISAVQACCACGGGVNDSPTERTPVVPYPYEGDDPHCEDMRITSNAWPNMTEWHEDLYWLDRTGYSCRAYHYGGFCTEEGEQAEGWETDMGFGSIKDPKYPNGLPASDPNHIEGTVDGPVSFNEACCACGGGIRSKVKAEAETAPKLIQRQNNEDAFDQSDDKIDIDCTGNVVFSPKSTFKARELYNLDE